VEILAPLFCFGCGGMLGRLAILLLALLGVFAPFSAASEAAVEVQQENGKFEQVMERMRRSGNLGFPNTPNSFLCRLTQSGLPTLSICTQTCFQRRVEKGIPSRLGCPARSF
jgi:hypothetical protein